MPSGYGKACTNESKVRARNAMTSAIEQQQQLVVVVGGDTAVEVEVAAVYSSSSSAYKAFEIVLLKICPIIIFIFLSNSYDMEHVVVCQFLLTATTTLKASWVSIAAHGNTGQITCFAQLSLSLSVVLSLKSSSASRYVSA